MNIRFLQVEIEGFQSIGSECTIDLNNQGIVAIRGINNSDNKASSNGSGKTTTIESINWCLFGKTSSGVSNVKNRYYDKGCYVSVKLEKDSVPYIITRTLDHAQYKTIVSISKVNTDGNIEDLSCRNKSDTDKKIKNEILPFSQDIFLSTIFLSQGFSGRLSLLTPSARKERLEILSNIEEKVSEFKDKVSEKKTKYQNEYLEQTKNKSYISGQIDIYTNEQIEINKIRTEGLSEVLPEDEISALKQKLASLDENYKSVSDLLTQTVINHSKAESEYKSFAHQLEQKEKEIEVTVQTANNLHVSSECPVCHQEIKDEKLYSELSKTYEKQYTALQEECNILNDNLNKSKLLLNTLFEKKEKLTNKKNTLSTMIDKISKTLSEQEQILKSNSTLQEKLSRLDVCKEQISSLTGELNKIAEESTITERNIDITDHMLKVITKDFRTHLLSNIIAEMNGKLKEYSSQLFESDIIQISTDNTKLDIMLNDSLYETLSGGEKKKVDLALVLAQRDIALRISGFNCNILILDEILENMDSTATDATLNLLNQVSDSVESLFLISHNNYSLPIDSTITVTKDSSRISTISFT